jgi:hypothetical protein
VKSSRQRWIGGTRHCIVGGALGEASYRRGHLPGAIRLQDTGAAAEVVPDQEAFVVAYCSDIN